mmetsp:Transcript_37958/g.72762  ORF Transcript_37958/g.72762 Transcript_37958/m.72762 type:complete len:299 (-) Transcript_37958:1195-2091(-)
MDRPRRRLDVCFLLDRSRGPEPQRGSDHLGWRFAEHAQVDWPVTDLFRDVPVDPRGGRVRRVCLRSGGGRGRHEGEAHREGGDHHHRVPASRHPAPKRGEQELLLHRHVALCLPQVAGADAWRRGRGRGRSRESAEPPPLLAAGRGQLRDVLHHAHAVCRGAQGAGVGQSGGHAGHQRGVHIHVGVGTVVWREPHQRRLHLVPEGQPLPREPRAAQAQEQPVCGDGSHGREDCSHGRVPAAVQLQRVQGARHARRDLLLEPTGAVRDDVCQEAGVLDEYVCPTRDCHPQSGVHRSNRS